MQVVLDLSPIRAQWFQPRSSRNDRMTILVTHESHCLIHSHTFSFHTVKVCSSIELK